jgi:hypothetical protein
MCNKFNVAIDFKKPIRPPMYEQHLFIKSITQLTLVVIVFNKFCEKQPKHWRTLGDEGFYWA